jgi:hypothetical protein
MQVVSPPSISGLNRLFNFGFRMLDFYKIGLILLLPALLPAQNSAPDTLRPVLTLAVQARYAEADQLSNVYLISAQNAVEKYDSSGRQLTRYSNNRLGRAERLDASNPLKILVWYPDFQTLVWLDRNLTELGILSLSEAGFAMPAAIAAASDGNLWLYDESLFRLLKVSPEGNVLVESQDFNLLFPKITRVAGIKESPAEITAAGAQGNEVFLMTESDGIHRFNIFGAYLGQWQPHNAALLDFSPALKLLLFEGGRMEQTRSGGFEKETPGYVLPHLPGDRYFLHAGGITLLRKKQVQVFKTAGQTRE